MMYDFLILTVLNIVSAIVQCNVDNAYTKITDTNEREHIFALRYTVCGNHAIITICMNFNLMQIIEFLYIVGGY